MKLNEELANWLADLREQWSGKIEEPLRLRWICLCYFLGAFTIFWFLVFFSVVVPAQGSISTNIPDTLGPYIPLILSLLLAVMIALLLSWPRRPYTPARMYLGGLAFAALVCLIVANVAGQLAKPLSNSKTPEISTDAEVSP